MSSYCVVCNQERGSNHKCPPRVEAAINAAHTRAANEETFLADYDPQPLGDTQKMIAGLTLNDLYAWLH